MKKPKIANLATKHIRIDGGTQTRAEINESAVADYAEAMKAGILLPAAVVFSDGSNNWLADGFHRFHAANTARVQLLCDIRPGTRRDAILFSVGANATHGIRRTNADKKKAVLTLLEDEEWGTRSDNWIAEQCGVSQPFVGTVRKESGYNGYNLREGADGKKYPVSERESAESEQKDNDEKSPEIDGESGQASNAREAEQLRAIEEAQAAPVEEEEQDPFDDSDDMPEDIKTARDAEEDRRAKEESEEEQERAESESEESEEDTLETRVKNAEVLHDTLDSAPKEADLGDADWLESLPLWRVLKEKSHKGIFLRADLLAGRAVQKQLKALATAARKHIEFKAEAPPQFAAAMIRAAQMPHPRDWQIHAPCRGNGCQKCGYAGYDTTGAGISAMRVESGEVTL